jgi:hypothetical protein
LTTYSPASCDCGFACIVRSTKGVCIDRLPNILGAGTILSSNYSMFARIRDAWVRRVEERTRNYVDAQKSLFENWQGIIGQLYLASPHDVSGMPTRPLKLPKGYAVIRQDCQQDCQRVTDLLNRLNAAFAHQWYASSFYDSHSVLTTASRHCYSLGELYERLERGRDKRATAIRWAMVCLRNHHNVNDKYVGAGPGSPEHSPDRH